MIPKRSFIAGTVNIENIKDAKALILNKIDIAHSPRGFQVKAVPSNDVVYWSFSRKKANNYIRNLAAERELNVSFGETLKGKSLDYNYRYSPNEYLLGFVFYVAISVFLVSSPPAEKLFTLFIFLLAIISLVQNIKSKKAYNKSVVD